MASDPIPDNPDVLSQPGRPSDDEISFRAKLIHGRATVIAAALLRGGFQNNDDITACALIALGASFLASPHSTIEPEYRLALTVEMHALGESMAQVAQVRAAQIQAELGRRQPRNHD